MKTWIYGLLILTSVTLYAEGVSNPLPVKDEAYVTPVISEAIKFSNTPPKSEACSGCHGVGGNSTVVEIPNIGGQHEAYLLQQLRDYQTGKRNNPIMKTCVASLSDQEMLLLSHFYSKQPLPKGETPKESLQRGQQLYRGGDLQKGIPACIACHGPRGTGNAQAGFAVLSGQHAKYTVAQLNAFREGKRKDPRDIMSGVCARMSQDDMQAVADYIQGLY